MLRLKRVTKSKDEFINLLGDEFRVVKSNYSKDDVCKISEACNGYDPNDSINGFVFGSNGTSYPLYLNSDYYVVNESGKTFSKIIPNGNSYEPSMAKEQDVK